MKQIGIRELKANLSRYLRDVRSGETIQVTDRGRVVAELRQPIAQRDASEGIADQLEAARARLAAEGVLRLAERPRVSYTPGPLQLPDGTALELLSEDRGER